MKPKCFPSLWAPAIGVIPVAKDFGAPGIVREVAHVEAEMRQVAVWDQTALSVLNVRRPTEDVAASEPGPTTGRATRQLRRRRSLEDENIMNATLAVAGIDKPKGNRTPSPAQSGGWQLVPTARAWSSLCVCGSLAIACWT